MDYSALLNNTSRRRFDEIKGTPIYGPSFEDESIAEPVRYVLENMLEVQVEYAQAVYTVAEKMKKELEASLRAEGLTVDTRYQGSLKTQTNVRLYGEVDIFFILSDSAKSKDVLSLSQRLNALIKAQNHQGVNHSGSSIRVKAMKPSCIINVIPGSWLNNPDYVENSNEIFRGVAIYNFKEKTRKRVLPFLNMARMDTKNRKTKGGYKMAIRLLRSLSIDHSIPMAYGEIAGLLFGMDNNHLISEENNRISLLPNVYKYISESLKGENFEHLKSPGGRELVFGKNSDRKQAVSELNNILGQLIGDLKEHCGEDLSKPVEYNLEPA